MSTSKVAVVIPCWNGEKWVARAIQSVLDQDYPHVECIVIDDGSTDRSIDVIRSFGDRIKWETGPNRGAPAARNQGMALTDAEFVQFLDADDYILPDATSHWVPVMQNCDVVFGVCRHEPTGRVNAYQNGDDAETIIRGWLLSKCIGPCSVLWRKSFLSSIGGWDETLQRNQDGELVLRALIDGARVGVSEAGVGIYVKHGLPSRLSAKGGRPVIEQRLHVFDRLRERARRKGWKIDDAFGLVYYVIARDAFTEGFDGLGCLALKESRKLGFRGHRGSRTHRILSSLVGIKNKVRIRNVARKIQAHITG